MIEDISFERVKFIGAYRFQVTTFLNCTPQKSPYYNIFFFPEKNSGSFMLNGNWEDIVNNRLFFITPNVEFKINCDGISVDCFHICFDSSDNSTDITSFFMIIPKEYRDDFVKRNLSLAISCIMQNHEQSVSRLKKVIAMLDQMTSESQIVFATRNVGRTMRDIPRHFHFNEYQIDFFDSGGGSVFLGHRWEEYTPGSIIFVPPQIHHEIIFYQSTELDNYSVKFKFLSDKKINIFKEPFIIQVSKEKKAVLLSLLKKIVGEFVMDLPISPRRLNNLINLISEIKSSAEPNTLDNTDLVYKVKKIVNQNFSKELLTSDIAYKVGLSPEYLSRQFKKLTGKTLIAYINTQRLNSSLIMLQNTKMPLKQIASECGFKNVYYFSTIFKKNFSLTPIEVRKQTIKKTDGQWFSH